MRFPQLLPQGTTTRDALARELLLLLGYTAPEGTLLAEDARVLGEALADAWQALEDAGAEAFVHLATQLLAEWEARVGLPVAEGSSDADRQASLTAKRRATGGSARGRVLAAVQAFDPSASTILTTSATEAAALYDARLVFRWGVAVSAGVYASSAEPLRLVLAQLKPAHTECVLGTLGDGGVFCCDDPDSLCDQTLLGG